MGLGVARHTRGYVETADLGQLTSDPRATMIG